MAKHQRIVLLLDLDCFYAQCEMIRLNIDRSQPVCLLQWNSALAINYPAREKYKFKRGVSFEEIMKASNGECIALHLPVISLQDNHHHHHHHHHYYEEIKNEQDKSWIGKEELDGGRLNNNDETITGNSTSSLPTSHDIETLYNQEYNQPQHIKTKLFHQEKNIMKKPYQGKASLERYRLASTFIFETIKDSLDCQQKYYNDCSSRNGHGNGARGKCNSTCSRPSGDYFILEKASVDELYLDVTNICYDFDIEHVWKDINYKQHQKDHQTESSNNSQNYDPSSLSPSTSIIEKLALDETVIYAKDKIQSSITHNKNHNEDKNQSLQDNKDTLALKRGCIIARGIRRAVYDKLGFTLSAGISTSKLVAKLGATYGKPNGQAVVLPEAIPYLMNETPIKKARNLGGKIGKEVLKLLPPNEDRMSSIAQYLSLNELNDALGYQNAKMVFDACRGIDDEPVKETKGALSKSITAFKSFGPTKISCLGKWITLLATDVFKRVNVDCIRNNRFPKICTIQYYYRKETDTKNDRVGHSLRTPFPSMPMNKSQDQSEQVAFFVERVQELIKAKCSEDIVRLGLCATGFVDRASQESSISSYFQTDSKMSSNNSKKSSPLSAASCSRKKPSSGAITTKKSILVSLIQKKSKQQSSQCELMPGKETKAFVKTQKDEITSKHGKDLNGMDGINTCNNLPRRKAISSSSDVDTKSPSINQALTECNVLQQSPDLAYAIKLQASYDRENEILSKTERGFGVKKKGSDSFKSSSHRRPKKARIDSFFYKIKK